jgi:hypothetical protein
VPRIAFIVAASLTAFALAAQPTTARDTSLKVLLDGEYWFCQEDPTGWPLADFKSVCSLIGPGGKGAFVEFIVDAKGKVRRKPVNRQRTEMRAIMRGSLL